MWSSRRTRAVANIPADKVKAGDGSSCATKAPGRPRHARDAVPHQLHQVQGPGQSLCAADRWALLGRHSGLSIGHARPKPLLAARIGLRAMATASASTSPTAASIVLVSDEELAQRRAEQDAKGWKPAQPRPRKVSAAPKATIRQAGHVGLQGRCAICRCWTTERLALGSQVPVIATHAAAHLGWALVGCTDPHAKAAKQ